MLADFLANSSTKTNAKDQEKDMILDIVDKISPLHLTLLKTITYYLIKGSGIDNVMLWVNYDPDATEKLEFKYVQEVTLVELFTEDISQGEIIEASLIYLEWIGLLEWPSARGWTTLWWKLWIKGYRPTKLWIKVLQYLWVDIKNIPDSFQIEKIKY